MLLTTHKMIQCQFKRLDLLSRRVQKTVKKAQKDKKYLTDQSSMIQMHIRQMKSECPQNI